MPPLTVVNFTSAPAGTRTVYLTCAPTAETVPLVRGDLGLDPDARPGPSPLISMRSSAAFGGFGRTLRAVLVRDDFDVLPSDGVTSIWPLTLLISTRPPGSRW